MTNATPGFPGGVAFIIPHFRIQMAALWLGHASGMSLQRGDNVLMYFFLDKKVPKNQGCIKKAKNFPSKLK